MNDLSYFRIFNIFQHFNIKMTFSYLLIDKKERLYPTVCFLRSEEVFFLRGFKPRGKVILGHFSGQT